MRRVTQSLLTLAVLASVVPLMAQPTVSAEAAKDPIIAAMTAELGRAKSLVLTEPSYFWELTVSDDEAFSTTASFGATMGSSESRNRVPRIINRVGSYEFDNSNYALSGRLARGRGGEDLPVENSVPALRHAFWLLMDRVYRDATLSLGQKKVAVNNLTNVEKLDDFAKAPPVTLFRSQNVDPPNGQQLEAVTRSLSAIFVGYPKVLDSSVETQVNRSLYYLLNTEGSLLRIPDNLSLSITRASGLAPDGMVVYDADFVLAEGPKEFPAPAAWSQRVKDVAENVTKMTSATVGEAYVGPMLFEGPAAPQLVAQLIGRNLEVNRKPVLPPNSNVPFPSTEFDGRLNGKVLPDAFTVVDDPTISSFHGVKLAGGYPVDIEAVVPKAVTVIEKGVLKGFLTTRQPRRNIRESNGRARVPGEFGNNGSVFFSNLICQVEGGSSPAELKAKLLQLLKDRGKPYGVIVRKLDFPSVAPLELARASLGRGDGSTVSPPLLIYKVYPDGREELMRGVRFKGLNAKSLRDIIATSSEPTVFNFIGNRAPWSYVGLSPFVAPASVVAPSLLLDEVEIEKIDSELQKLPVVPPPDRASR